MNLSCTTLARLRAFNGQLEIFDCADPEFRRYGRLIEGYDFAPYLEFAASRPNPDTGVSYVPGIPELEAMPVSAAIQSMIFGELPIQVGWCRGYNLSLNAFEYHKSSEINVAVTDLLLILGLVGEIRDHTYDTTLARGFLLQRGMAAELYQSTLHFAPVHTVSAGFCAIVILPKSTNLPLTESKPDAGEGEDRLLFMRNKWLLAYPGSDQEKRGAHAGMRGEKITVRID